MARIDAARDPGRPAVGDRRPTSSTRRIAHVRHALDGHALRVDADARREVEIDPRLTSVALSHLLENAAQYSPTAIAGSTSTRSVEDEGLHIRSPIRARPRSRRARSPVRAFLSRAMPRASRRSAPAWDWRSREGCWPRQAAGSGPRTSRRRRTISRSSCRARRAPATVVALTWPSRILVVDDEPNILATVAPLLRDAATTSCRR